MVAEDTKKRIEAMTIGEMAYEINRGHRSRFQRDNFAYLKTCHEARLREIVPVPNSAPNPSGDTPNKRINFFSIPKGSALIRVAFEVVVLVIGSAVIYLIRHDLGIPL